MKNSVFIAYIAIVLLSLPLCADHDEEVLEALELLQMSKIEEALPILDTILQKEPENGMALFLRGMALARSERYEEALVDLRKSEKLGFEFSVKDLEYGRVYFFLRKYPLALKHLRQYEKDYPGEQETARLTGYAYFFLGQYDNAKKYMEQALERGSEDSDSLNYCLALCAVQQKKPKTMMDRLRKTMRVSTQESWFKQSATRLANIADTFFDKADKPWWVQVQIGGGYDDNPRTFGEELPDDIDQRQDLFLQYLLRGQYDVKLGLRTLLYMRGSFFGKAYYEEGDDLDQLVPGAEIAVYHKFNEFFETTVGARNDYIALGYESFSNNLTGFIDLTFNYTEWQTTTLSYELQYRWFYFDVEQDEDDLEGLYHTIGVKQYFFLKPIKTDLNIGYKRLIAYTEGSNLDRQVDIFFLQTGSYVVWDFYAGFRLEFQRGDFLNNNTFDDGGGQRFDKVYRFQAFFSKKLIENTSLFISYSYERVDSNIDAFFDFYRNIVTAGFLVTY